MEDLQNGNSQTHHHQSNPSDPHLQSSLEPTSSHDDFLEQMLSTLPNCSWPDLSSSSTPKPHDDAVSFHVNGNSSPMAAAKSFLLQQQLLLSRGVGSPSALIPLPLSLASGDSLDSRLHDMVADGPSFKSTPQGADGSVQSLFDGFPGPPLHGNGQTTTSQQQFQQAVAGAMGPAPASASTGGSGQAPQRQRVRARRGQATDPHSIAERLRRERIAERMKALQELVPNGNKTDKASMLDEIIDYVKFLQLQVKVLSMSRLGGASAVAPRGVADLSSEGGRSSNNGNPGVGSSNDGMSVTEHQVVKLMEEDMGSAMQYLQGKGLCLMPISLATAISTATCNTRNSGSLHNNNHRHHHPPPPQTSNNPNIPLIGNGNGEGPSSPNLSGLTVQSANLVNGDGSNKDSNPPSKA